MESSIPKPSKQNIGGVQIIANIRAKEWITKYLCEIKGYSLDLIPVIDNGIRYFSIYRFTKKDDMSYVFIFITPAGSWKIDEGLCYLDEITDMRSWLMRRCKLITTKMKVNNGILMDACKVIASHYDENFMASSSPYKIGGLKQDEVLILCSAIDKDTLDHLKMSLQYRKSQLKEKEGISSSLKVSSYKFRY